MNFCSGLKALQSFLVAAANSGNNFCRGGKLFYNAQGGLKRKESRSKRKNNLKGKLPLMKLTALLFRCNNDAEKLFIMLLWNYGERAYGLEEVMK